VTDPAPRPRLFERADSTGLLNADTNAPADCAVYIQPPCELHRRRNCKVAATAAATAVAAAAAAVVAEYM